MKPHQHNIAPGTQTTTFWLDESGSKGSANKCFVVAGIKTRHPDNLLREIHSIRERHGFHRSEFKFGRISKVNYRPMVELVDVLEASDAHIMATVVDSRHNPFKGRAQWEAQATIISQLIVGNINKNEVGVAFMDGISTPPGSSLGHHVKRAVNSRLGGQSLVAAISLDSKANDLLQAADLIAGAVRHQRLGPGRDGSGSAEKRQVAARLAAAFGVTELGDQRRLRVNIATLRGPKSGEKPLRLIKGNQSAS
jgi:hypothetical protein